MSAVPHHRFLVAQAAAAQKVPPPGDARVVALYALLLGQPGTTPDDEAVRYAYDIYAVEAHRVVVDAFLLARNPLPATAALLEIPLPVLEMYAFLFMDITIFRNRLEIITYASDYQGSAYGAELMRAAVQVGPSYLYWAYGGDQEELDTRTVVRRAMADSFFRGMAHKGNSLTSGIAKEAQRWWNMAIRNAETLEKLDPRTSRAAIEELRIALEAEDDTCSIEDSPVPVDELLH